MAKKYPEQSSSEFACHSKRNSFFLRYLYIFARNHLMLIEKHLHEVIVLLSSSKYVAITKEN